MKTNRFISLCLASSCFMSSAVFAGVCDNVQGAAFGLCNSYCIAKKCTSAASNGSNKSCDVIKNNYVKLTGIPVLPCEEQPAITIRKDIVTSDGTVLDGKGTTFNGMPKLILNMPTPGMSDSRGGSAYYHFTVTNTGNTSLSNVNVLDQFIAPDASFLSIVNDTCTDLNTQLPVGGTTSCDITVRSTTNGMYENVATVSGKSPNNAVVQSSDSAAFYGFDFSLCPSSLLNDFTSNLPTSACSISYDASDPTGPASIHFQNASGTAKTDYYYNFQNIVGGGLFNYYKVICSTDSGAGWCFGSDMTTGSLSANEANTFNTCMSQLIQRYCAGPSKK